MSDNIQITKDHGVLATVSGIRDGANFSFQIVTNIHAFGIEDLQIDIDKWLSTPRYGQSTNHFKPQGFCAFVNRRKSNPKFKELFCVTKDQFDKACASEGYTPTVEKDFKQQRYN